MVGVGVCIAWGGVSGTDMEVHVQRQDERQTVLYLDIAHIIAQVCSAALSVLPAGVLCEKRKQELLQSCNITLELVICNRQLKSMTVFLFPPTSRVHKLNHKHKKPTT